MTLLFPQYLLVELYLGVGTIDIFFILSFITTRYILFASEITNITH